jgi:hypothetical protein
MTAASREKSVELAERRVNRAVKDIRLIGNLSSRSSYSYDEGDVRQIFVALEKEIKQARDRFQASGAGIDSKPLQLTA